MKKKIMTGRGSGKCVIIYLTLAMKLQAKVMEQCECFGSQLLGN